MKQGRSTAISADGNTVIIGGYGDNFSEGGAWIFTRNNGIWSQYGYKLLSTAATGVSTEFGYSVSMSSDGNIAVIGAPSDAFGNGAGWVYADSSIILPVTITKFQAYISGRGTQTAWQVYSELNLDRYIVERSADGYGFKALSNVPVKQSSGENNYGWFDPSPLNGDNYYRLKAINKNGTFIYSPIVKITIGAASSGEIIIFPNPSVDNHFYLQLNNLPASDYDISLYNNSGSRVYITRCKHNAGSETLRIYARDISAGIYYVEVASTKCTYRARVLLGKRNY